MTPAEILEAVLAMTPEELTEKVAELRGIHPVMTEDYPSRICHWENEDESVIEELGEWSPPTHIADALELLKDLGRACIVDIIDERISLKDDMAFGVQITRVDEKDWSFDMFWPPFSFSAWEELPLAIARAYAWWKWCEKEEKP